MGKNGWGRGKKWVGDEQVQATMYKINKIQRYIIQHREYSQYFITLNKTEYNLLKSELLCCTSGTNKILYINYILN